MPARRPLVNVSGAIQELPTTDTLVCGGATLSDTGVLSGATFGEARELLGNVTTSGATTISIANGPVQRIVLGGAHQISLPADPGAVSLSLTLILLCQGFTPTWGSSPTITWINADGSGAAPTLNTASGKQNVITFVWDDNAAGTGTWLGFFGGRAA